MGYPLEFRNNVVRSILSDGTRISDAAKEYQVARVTIYSWLKVARKMRLPYLPRTLALKT